MATNARGRSTHQRLLDATERAFVENGWSFSIEQVAVAAGVVRPTVYQHFSGRDDLLTAMLLRSSLQLAERLTAVFESELPWEERLVDVVVMIVTDVRATPHLNALVRGGEVTSVWPAVDEDRRFLDAVFEFFRHWLERAVTEGLRLRAPIDDVLDWILRTTMMQLTILGMGGVSTERLRFEVETFLLPAILADGALGHDHGQRSPS